MSTTEISLELHLIWSTASMLYQDFYKIYMKSPICVECKFLPWLLKTTSPFVSQRNKLKSVNAKEFVIIFQAF